MLLIPYYRVASAKQRKSGNPGLEAQREKVQNLAAAIHATTAHQDFIEIEAHAETRPQLNKAVSKACKCGASVVVGKLFSLARDADFLAKLETIEIERKASFKGFLFADLPPLFADHSPPTRSIMTALISALAQLEQQAKGRSNREAAAVSKAKGKNLGGARPGTTRANASRAAKAIAESERLRPLLAPLHAQGVSLRKMATALTQAGITTNQGNPMSATQVKRHLMRLGLEETKPVPGSTIFQD